MAEKKLSFEDAMQKLQEVTALLENGTAPLDETLKLYEEGMALIRACNKRLDEAERRVLAVKETAEGTEKVPFEAER